MAGEDSRKWVSTGVAARLLGVAERTVRHYAGNGMILAKRTPGGQWRVAVDGSGGQSGKTTRKTRRKNRQKRQNRQNRQKRHNKINKTGKTGK